MAQPATCSRSRISRWALPQTQTFSYDPLDRLLSASASGGFNGVGDYSQGYSYDPLSGNLAAKGGVSYSYGDSSHAHAVTSLSNGGSFQYDANGNMTQRTVNGQTYNLSYDAENRLAGVSGASTASFTYNGDGERVVSTVGGAVVVYVGEYFEWQPATTALTKYYYAGEPAGGHADGGGRAAVVVGRSPGQHIGGCQHRRDPAQQKRLQSLWRNAIRCRQFTHALSVHRAGFARGGFWVVFL